MLLGILIVFWCLGFLLLLKRTSVAKNAEFPSMSGMLSIIIPARNEEENLKKLFTSLGLQNLKSINSEVIVVNDGSTDKTEAVASRWGAKVVNNPELSEGWTGKTWALHNGVLNSSGDLFVFMDADIELEPGALARILNDFSDKPDTALAVLPFHRIKEGYEKLSLFFNILMAMGTDAFSWLPGVRHKLVGQFLVIRKAHYEKIGGYESVRSEVLENFFLTNHIHKSNLKTQTLSGKGLVNFRMFTEGKSQLVEGWQKAFTRGSGAVAPLTLIISIFWLTSLMTAISVSPLYPMVSFKMYLLGVVQVYVFQKIVGNFSLLAAIAWPYYLIFYQYIFFKSIYLKRSGKKLKWRGREV